MAEQIKDIDEENRKEAKEIEHEAKAVKKSSFANVPTAFKISGLLFIFLKYNEITRNNGNLSELWIYIIIVGVVWYFLGMDYKMNSTGILTPKQAYDKLREEIAIMYKDGRIKANQKVIISPVQNIGTHESIPTYYIFSVVIMSSEGDRFKYKGIVYAKGEMQGIACLTKESTEIRGDETQHTKSIVPSFVKNAEKYPTLKGLFGLGGNKM